MKRKKLISIICMTCITALLLSGCGSVRSAWIAARLGGALKKEPITEMKGKVSGTLDGTILSIERKTEFSVDFHTVRDAETGRSFSQVDTSTEVLGIDVPQSLQVYQIPKGGKTTSYVHLMFPDIWAKSTADVDTSKLRDMDSSVIMLLIERASQDAEITEAQLNGEKVYRLSLKFSAKQLREDAHSLGLELPGDLDRVNLNGVNVPVELEISAKTYLPKALRMRITGLNGPVMRAIYDLVGQEMKGVELHSGTLNLRVTEFGYREQSVAHVPQEGVEKAAKMEDLFDFLSKLFG